MLKGFRTFREFVDYLEGATIKTIPGSPGTPAVNPDADVDQEITNNPQLLTNRQSQNPQKNRTVVNQALQSKKMNNKVSLDAALKAAQMSQNRLS